MKRFVNSFRILWRSERLLAEKQFQLGARRVQFNALAALVAVFGLVMLSISVFYALAPHWGHALAALTVGVVDLVLAAVLAVYARSLQEPTEVEMVREVRNMALNDLEEEVALVETELNELKDEAREFLRNPVDALLPDVIGPLLGSVVRGLGSGKK